MATALLRLNGDNIAWGTGNLMTIESLLVTVRPDVTTLVTGNTEQRVTQTRNCTATSGRREGTKLWFNAMKEKTGDKVSVGFLHNSTQQVVVTEIL